MIPVQRRETPVTPISEEPPIVSRAIAANSVSPRVESEGEIDSWRDDAKDAPGRYCACTADASGEMRSTSVAGSGIN